MPHNILWLTENYFPRTGGMAQSCDRIVYNLRQAGLTIHLIHFTTQTIQKIETVYNGINLHFPFVPPYQEAAIDESHSLHLLWLEINTNPKFANLTHIVCFGGHLTMTAAPVFAAWLGLPLVVLLRGNDFDASVFSPKKREILDYALNKAHAIACVSSEKAEKVKKMYPQKQVFFTPNGIDSQEWKPIESDREKAKSLRNTLLANSLTKNITTTITTKAEKTDEKRIIGLFGQLKAKKGLLFFMEALQKSSFAAQTELLIVGEMAPEIQHFLAISDLLFTYTHIPFMARFDLLPYYLACDVLAIPSFYDGMPNVLLEAGAVGLPFISADSGGMPDVLTADLAWIFKAGDINSCITALENFWTCDLITLKQKGLETQKHIQTYFTHEIEKNNYIALLNTINSTNV
jgi:glycogen(starch) synthase